MAKIFDRGSAKPDDPIYSSGLVIGGKRLDGPEPEKLGRGDESPSESGNSDKGAIRERKPLTIRHATYEDYRARQNWTVGTFHRMVPEIPIDSTGPANDEKSNE